MLFILVVFNLLLYARTLTYHHVIDDIEWQRRIDSGFLRQHPFHILYSHWGLPHTIDHAITLFLHIITSVLLSLLTHSIIPGLLWSAHPCTHQTAIWLNGRRYSLLNIFVLIVLITHTYYLFIPVAILLARFALRQLSMRRDLPSTPPTHHWLLPSLLRLSGFPRYAFIYPSGPSSFIPHTQPCAERYLSLPLLFLLTVFHPIILLPFLIYRTLQLTPMYRDIQSFYDYHRPLLTTSRISILTHLYPEIQT